MCEIWGSPVISYDECRVFRRNLLHPSSEYIYAGDVNSCVSETSAYIQQSARLVSQKSFIKND